MQSVTLKQNIQKVEAELSSMGAWAQRKLEHGNRQGSLDVRYLTERYGKGVSKVQQFCDAKHKQIGVNDDQFGACQAEIVNFCVTASPGGQALLIWIEFGFQLVFLFMLYQHDRSGLNSAAPSRFFFLVLQTPHRSFEVFMIFWSNMFARVCNIEPFSKWGQHCWSWIWLAGLRDSWLVWWTFHFQWAYLQDRTSWTFAWSFILIL